MSEITINFALPDFAGMFTWEGETSGAVETVAAVEETAKRMNLDFRTLTLNSVGRAAVLLRSDNSVVQEMAKMAIVAFILRQPTGNADHPGLIGDYVGVADFEITFNSVSGSHISYTWMPYQRVAGSA